MKAALAHAAAGFALVIGLWSLDALPSAWPQDSAAELQDRHADEDSEAIARQLSAT